MTILHLECSVTAKGWGISELWEQSQRWSGFEKAWQSYVVAYGQFLCKRLPSLKKPSGVEATQRGYQQAMFLAGIECGRGQDPEWYRVNAKVIHDAALIGDIEFFNRFIATRRRKLEAPLQHQLIACWMTAGLWNATDTACFQFLDKHPRWKFDTDWHNPDSLRQRRMELKLPHSAKPAIKGWQWTDGNKRLECPKPIFKPTRIPKV